ncbi:methyltransferase domain-containing protein [Salmonirosea aquatica]|uniref:Methyltransferase domain-containing protein n=1 Tax=Salmonirosea aquatica TaxID=2654236 RepID=A0A7C9BEP2_9BACT|nr:methyltransferase domain-containing protein [Cytophagaceae bacterium SJW1-29]
MKGNFELIDREKCPLCGSKDFKVYLNFDKISILKCRNCSFIYSGATLSDDSLKEYYRSSFGGDRQKKGQIVNSIVNFKILDKILDLKAGMSILDVGTGYGFLLLLFKEKKGLDVTGMEFSLDEAIYAKETLSLDIITTPLEQSDLGFEKFDIVCAFEVIEHTIDPIIFLDNLKKYLKPSGELVIVTDNFESKVVKELGAGWPKWIPHTHISHFSPQTLSYALEKSGFSIVKKASFTPWEHSFRNSLYKLFSIHKTPEEAYNLESALKNETEGDYKFYKIRKLLSPYLSLKNLKGNLNEAMMFTVSQKK